MINHGFPCLIMLKPKNVITRRRIVRFQWFRSQNGENFATILSQRSNDLNSYRWRVYFFWVFDGIFSKVILPRFLFPTSLFCPYCPLTSFLRSPIWRAFHPQSSASHIAVSLALPPPRPCAHGPGWSGGRWRRHRCSRPRGGRSTRRPASQLLPPRAARTQLSHLSLLYM